MTAPVALIGIGADGCASLSSRAVNAVARAQVLVGGERQLAFFPQFAGERIVLRGGLGPVLAGIAERAEDHAVAILASGDPMFFGVGARVVERIGAAHVEVIPQPSAMQWAFARVGLPWQDAALVSVHGRSLAGFVARLRRAPAAACFTDAEHSPPRLAQRLLDYGDAAWTAWVCENLGAPNERVRQLDLAALAGCDDVAALNVLVLARPAGWRAPPVLSNEPEEAFSRRMPKRGLITKREVRALALSALRLRADSTVWDIGAGSGAVAIEAALLACRGRAFAIEVDPEGVAICRDNARAHGADNVEVVAGRAPEALRDLPDPDAVFVGGSKGSMDAIVGAALERLRPGGRLVVTAITLDNVADAYRALRDRGVEPDVTLIQISRGAPLARYLRYEALNPIHLFAASKEPT